MSASDAVVFDLGGVVVTWDPEAIVASVFEDPSEQALALEGVFADPDWVELVTDLRDAGNRLLVLSNLHRASLAHLQSAHDLFGLFDGRIVSCEVGSCKLEAAIYRRLLTEFGLDPGACVFIDDSPANLEAATAHGMLTIRFTDAESGRAELRALERI